MIPPFDERGNLPPGIHKANWEELEARLGGTPWRRALLVGLREALESLRAAGCLTAYVDGSFVSADEAPGDFDVCWEPDGVDFSALDPALLDFSAGRLTQKKSFRGELFPADMIAERGLRVLDFFQLDRARRAKGVIEIDLGSGL
jgi:hypothetical protein